MWSGTAYCEEIQLHVQAIIINARNQSDIVGKIKNSRRFFAAGGDLFL